MVHAHRKILSSFRRRLISQGAGETDGSAQRMTRAFIFSKSFLDHDLRTTTTMMKHVAVAFLLLMMGSAASIRRMAHEEVATNPEKSVRDAKFVPVPPPHPIGMLNVQMVFLTHQNSSFPSKMDREEQLETAPRSSTLRVRPRCQVGMLWLGWVGFAPWGL